MVLFGLVVIVLALALITRAGVWLIERRHRPSGRFIEVNGARLHVVELGPEHSTTPPLVLLHGASSNLEAMRQPLGELLAARHRVILIDRPGHGFSTRRRAADSGVAAQAAMIAAALDQLGVARAIVVAHSWAGALGAALALGHRERLAGLVLLAPVTHPWNGGVSWHNGVATAPLLGWLFTRLVALPIGLFMLRSGARSVFAPQLMPADYVRDTAIALLLRPREFTANAHDMIALKPSVAAQAGRYHEITTPSVVISGTVDRTVSIDIHSRPFVAAVPGARLIALSGVGHVPQNVAPGVVVDAIEDMVASGVKIAVADVS
ncbi:MAG: alpha/beta hydrolase [Xanthobacteraceae bacterium]|nr:alpha/beta hydrolase [Xanthobacteraceae bacterium]